RHAPAGSRLVAGHLLGAVHQVAGHRLAATTAIHTHLGGRGRGPGAAYGLELFVAQVLGTGDPATGTRLVPGHLHRTPYLGARDRAAGVGMGQGHLGRRAIDGESGHAGVGVLGTRDGTTRARFAA